MSGIRISRNGTKWVPKDYAVALVRDEGAVLYSANYIVSYSLHHGDLFVGRLSKSTWDAVYRALRAHLVATKIGIGAYKYEYVAKPCSS